MRKIPPPEEFLKERFLRDLTMERIHSSFRCEMNWLSEYKNDILAIKEEELLKVIAKANFLMNACLRADNKAINEFLACFGKLDTENDSFVLDYKKIINEK